MAEEQASAPSRGPADEQRATIATSSGPIELAYQSFGSPDAPTFLLITGWFSDLTLWPVGFCHTLAELGYRVIRYDNRDAGLSTRTSPEALEAEGPPYTLSDLAVDAVALLDAIKVPAGHVAGFAFGGTIAHFVAIEHPSRVLSLVPMATASGSPTDRDGNPLPPPAPEVIAALRTPFPEGEQAQRAHHRTAFSAMAGPSFDEADYARQQQESVERGAAPARGALQSALAASAGDRSAALGTIEVPTLVVHAELDPLVSLAAAEAQTAAIPDAELLVLEGIGHGVLPERHWQRLAVAMDQNARRAKAAAE